MTAPTLLRVFHKVVGKEQDTTLFFVACHKKDVDIYSAPLESVILFGYDGNECYLPHKMLWINRAPYFRSFI